MKQFMIPILFLIPLFFSFYGGEAHFTLSAGKAQAGRNYLLLGGMSGTVPGTPLPGGMAILPLNWDSLTNVTLMYANTSVFKNFLGTLDGKGGGAATLVLLPPLQGVAGLDMFYAYALAKPWDFASNAVKITFVP